MAVTWNITKVDSSISDGSIRRIHWEATDYETVQDASKQVIHRGRRYGSVDVEADPSAEGFIAWADVTKDITIGWAKTALGEEEVSSIESVIAQDISLSKNPPEHEVNPWDWVDPEIDVDDIV
jgi:hypothetical protein